MLKYLKKLLNSEDSDDVKRAIGLVCTIFFIIASFVILLTKRVLPNPVLADKILLYNVVIVLTSIFGMSIETVGNIILEAAKARAAAYVFGPETPNVMNPVTPPPPGKDEDGGDLPGDNVLKTVARTKSKIRKTPQQKKDIEDIKNSFIQSLKPKKRGSR